MSTTKEETVYRSRVFLDDVSLAAVASSVDVTTLKDEHDDVFSKFVSINLTIVDGDGDRVDLSFWEESGGDRILVLHRLRDELDKLIAVAASA